MTHAETHAKKLHEALSKVPKGMRYIDSPNFLEIQKLLEEGTPLFFPIKEGE
jgi:hypothetical protein